MPKKYTVRQGDTLQSIAVNECGSIGMVQYIMKDNGLSSPSAIVPGQVLILNCDEEFTEIAPRPPELDEDTAG
jgi:LysM repeat protein